MLKAFGDYPMELLRFLEKRDHARDFVEHGQIRLGVLEYYKDRNGGVRRDPGEGTGNIVAPEPAVETIHVGFGDRRTVSVAPGHANHHSVFVNPTYILSFSDPSKVDVEILKERFGRFVVRVSDPRRLAQDLTDHFTCLDVTHPLAGAVIECVAVDYDRHYKREHTLTKGEKLRLAYAQKPREYQMEGEVRMVAFARVPIEDESIADHITIDLGKALPYAEIVASF